MSSISYISLSPPSHFLPPVLAPPTLILLWSLKHTDLWFETVRIKEMEFVTGEPLLNLKESSIVFCLADLLLLFLHHLFMTQQSRTEKLRVKIQVEVAQMHIWWKSRACPHWLKTDFLGADTDFASKITLKFKYLSSSSVFCFVEGALYILKPPVTFWGDFLSHCTYSWDKTSKLQYNTLLFFFLKKFSCLEYRPENQFSLFWGTDNLPSPHKTVWFICLYLHIHDLFGRCSTHRADCEILSFLQLPVLNFKRKIYA